MGKKGKNDLTPQKLLKWIVLLLTIAIPIVTLAYYIGRYVEKIDTSLSVVQKKTDEGMQQSILDRVGILEEKVNRLEKEVAVQKDHRAASGSNQYAFDKTESAFEIPFGQSPRVELFSQETDLVASNSLPETQTINSLFYSIVYTEYDFVSKRDIGLTGVLTVECYVDYRGKLSKIQVEFSADHPYLVERIENRLRGLQVSNAAGIGYRVKRSYSLSTLDQLQEQRDKRIKSRRNRE